MSDRQTYDTPPGIALGRFDGLADGTARTVRLHLPAGWFDGFLVRRGERLFGYLDSCPHAGVRLTRIPGDYLSPERDAIVCSWHGARFTIADGLCIGGPCGGRRLAHWPVAIVDGIMVTA